jgi:hypothetical protein
MKNKNANRQHKSRNDPNVYPEGWNYSRVKKIIKYYDRLKDEPVLKRSRISPANDAVWMEIPRKLVSKVEKLLIEMKKSA